MSDIIFSVDHHDEVTDVLHRAGAAAKVSPGHASNLVYRGLARYAEPTTSAPDPAADKPASSKPADNKTGAAGDKGKE